MLLPLPACLCFLVLGAHFLHGGTIVPTSVCILLAMLVWSAARWFTRIAEILLALASIEWIFTALTLHDERAAVGADWHRGVAILLAVAAFNLIAAVLLERRARQAPRAPTQEHPA